MGRTHHVYGLRHKQLKEPYGYDFPTIFLCFRFSVGIPRSSFFVREKNEDLCRNICFFPLYKSTDLFVRPHSAIKRKLRKREAEKIIKHWNLLVIYSRNKNLGRPEVSKCAFPHTFSQNTLFRWLLCHPTTNLNGKSLSLSISSQNLPATLNNGYLGYSFIHKPSRVLEKGGYKCERSSTKIQPFLLFFSHLFLVVFSPVSAFSTFPFLHSWGRWFEVPEPVQKKCLRISLVLQFNSPRSHCSSTIAKLFIFIWQNFTFKNSKQISGS